MVQLLFSSLLWYLPHSEKFALFCRQLPSKLPAKNLPTKSPYILYIYCVYLLVKLAVLYQMIVVLLSVTLNFVKVLSLFLELMCICIVRTSLEQSLLHLNSFYFILNLHTLLLAWSLQYSKSQQCFLKCISNWFYSL